MEGVSGAGPGGTDVDVGRIKIVYWALVGVLAALTFFLLAAGTRVLRDRRGRPDAAA